MKNCSFTGHRIIPKEHLEYVKKKLNGGINYAYENGCRIFHTGGALGFDTLAAQAVIAFRASHPNVRLVLVLPCREQADGWTEPQRAEYEKILKSADSVIYISENYHKDCMRVRNAYLAQNADMLLSYVYKARSGAAQTVRMAERLNVKIFNLCPKFDK